MFDSCSQRFGVWGERGEWPGHQLSHHYHTRVNTNHKGRPDKHLPSSLPNQPPSINNHEASPTQYRVKNFLGPGDKLSTREPAARAVLLHMDINTSIVLWSLFVRQTLRVVNKQAVSSNSLRALIPPPFVTETSHFLQWNWSPPSPSTPRNPFHSTKAVLPLAVALPGPVQKRRLKNRKLLRSHSQQSSPTWFRLNHVPYIF